MVRGETEREIRPIHPVVHVDCDCWGAGLGGILKTTVGGIREREHIFWVADRRAYRFLADGKGETIAEVYFKTLRRPFLIHLTRRLVSRSGAHAVYTRVSELPSTLYVIKRELNFPYRGTRISRGEVEALGDDLLAWKVMEGYERVWILERVGVAETLFELDIASTSWRQIQGGLEIVRNVKLGGPFMKPVIWDIPFIRESSIINMYNHKIVFEKPVEFLKMKTTGIHDYSTTAVTLVFYPEEELSMTISSPDHETVEDKVTLPVAFLHRTPVETD
ncbi:MAG: hypothetical protein QXZ17_05585 [Nitrososphaerota archaeon]